MGCRSQAVKWQPSAQRPQARVTMASQPVIRVIAGAVKAARAHGRGETPEVRLRPGGVVVRPPVGAVDGRDARDPRHAIVQLTSAEKGE
ncbi:MAG TPA: hypothetical protein VLK82_21245 [Candidatus Tectomicrobia bacterium]|nr:hypothetical protein [Candidatus Tectomicrobia bacterium]